MIGAYGVAKVTEFLDEPIFRTFPLSGHSIKHQVAALGSMGFCWAPEGGHGTRSNPSLVEG
jgi:hypothetical protein